LQVIQTNILSFKALSLVEIYLTLYQTTHSKYYWFQTQQLIKRKYENMMPDVSFYPGFVFLSVSGIYPPPVFQNIYSSIFPYCVIFIFLIYKVYRQFVILLAIRI
jgi:hypothetical protein